MYAVRSRVAALLLLCVAASCLAFVSAEGDANVVVLTDNNFDATLREIPLALVEFYAPWCGHCKNLEPHWNQVADKLAENPAGLEGVKVCKIDADGEKKVPGQYRVTGFPTIKLFRSGQFAADFEGERTVDGILAYLKKSNEIAVNKEINSLEALKTLTSAKNLQRTTLVGFFSDKSSVDFKYYSEVVVPFAGNGIDAFHTSNPNVLEGFGFFGSGSSIVMYRPHAKPAKVTYRGTIFKQQLREWIVEHAVPQVGVFTKDSEALYKLSTAALVRVVVASPAPPSSITRALEAVAKKYAAVKFATSPLDEFRVDVEAQCGKDAVVCLLGHEPTKAVKGGSAKIFGRPLSSIVEVTEGTLSAFVEDLLAKKLTVRVKSEAAGPAPKAGEVAVIVGSTFQSLVMDADKDVFIEFYAPWCGHCKALAPKYDELAQELGPHFDQLLIAKLDLTNNDIPAEYKAAFPVEGFPTLFLAPRGKKTSPIKYESGREVADMKKWLVEKLSL